MKKGSKVICIDNHETDLTLYKVYTINEISIASKEGYILLNLYEMKEHGFFSTRFISLSKYRENKLIKLKEYE